MEQVIVDINEYDSLRDGLSDLGAKKKGWFNRLY